MIKTKKKMEKRKMDKKNCRNKKSPCTGKVVVETAPADLRQLNTTTSTSGCISFIADDAVAQVKPELSKELTAYRKGRAEAFIEAARIIDGISPGYSWYDLVKVSRELRAKSYDMEKPL